MIFLSITPKIIYAFPFIPSTRLYFVAPTGSITGTVTP